MKSSKLFTSWRVIAVAVTLTEMCVMVHGQASLRVRMGEGSTPELSIDAETGSVCQVQYVNNLLSSNHWLCLSNFTLTARPQWIADASSAGVTTRFYRAIAVARTMALIKGGSFAMGDTFGDLGADEVPVHTATVSGVYMDRIEVCKTLWDVVSSWAAPRGYEFSANAGLAKAATHPVTYGHWYDAVKWCNARSEMEGLTPCYYTNESQTGVYRAGEITISNSFVNWAANGYRLPTEAEWERAARGDVAGMRFPWSDANVISHTRANYHAGAGYAYDQSLTSGYHPAFSNAPAPYTSPCGYFAPNGFGLYDMAGNVWEWCWDWHDPYWYTNSAATQSDTRGPEGVSPSRRVRRGGNYASNAPDNCCALREGASPTSNAGFRCVRRATSADLVIIPAGSYEMGDTFGEGFTNELPVHAVHIGAFYLGRNEVTKELWDSVYAWGTSNGYEFENSGMGKGGDHPVHTISWYDAVRWCNARSEMEGLTPAYYLDTSLGASYVYRISLQAALWTNFVKWDANGYRLPTEAEWERAARGGLAGYRFPWGNTITHTQANYYSSPAYAYDVSDTRNYHTGYNNGDFPYTSPVTAFPSNTFGLHGMADDISEWCWDWFDAGFYSSVTASNDGCRGPRGDGMVYRVRRGGSWNLQANKARTAFRDYNAPDNATFYFGFRCARGL